MKIAFPMDTSNQVGTVNFMRCLTMADELKKQDAHIRSLRRNLPAYLSDMLRMKEIEYTPLKVNESEKKSIVFRRSLYVVQDLKVGNVLTTYNVRVIRPGLGLATKYFYVILNKTINKAVARGTALYWDLIA
jgi:sialic acid synthase SpsE